MLSPYKISVHSSVGEIRYTAYGRTVVEAAADLVEPFAIQHPSQIGKLLRRHCQNGTHLPVPTCPWVSV